MASAASAATTTMYVYKCPACNHLDSLVEEGSRCRIEDVDGSSVFLHFPSKVIGMNLPTGDFRFNLDEDTCRFNRIDLNDAEPSMARLHHQQDHCAGRTNTAFRALMEAAIQGFSDDHSKN